MYEYNNSGSYHNRTTSFLTPFRPIFPLAAISLIPPASGEKKPGLSSTMYNTIVLALAKRKGLLLGMLHVL